MKLITAYLIAFALPVILTVTGLSVCIPKVNKKIAQVEVKEVGKWIGRMLYQTILLENKANLRILGESARSGIETLLIQADEQGWSEDEALNRTLRYLDTQQAGEADYLSLINMNGMIVYHPIESRIGEAFLRGGSFPNIRSTGSAFIPGNDAGPLDSSYLVYIDALKLHLAVGDSTDGILQEIPPERFGDILDRFLSESVQVIVMRDSEGEFICGSSGYSRFSGDLIRAASLSRASNEEAAVLSKDRFHLRGTITGFDAGFEIIFDASQHREISRLHITLIPAAVLTGLIALVLTSLIMSRILLRPLMRTDEFFQRRRQNLERDLSVAESMFINNMEGVCVADNGGIILRVNSAFENLTGYSAEDVVGQDFRILNSGRHPRNFYRNILLDLKNQGLWKGEILNRRKDGTECTHQLTISRIPASDEYLGDSYISVLHDMSDLSHVKAKLHHLTNHDALTGLPNRVFLGTALEMSVKNCERHHRQLAVIFLDIDNFKDINDSLGHSAGDRLLKTTAKRITKLLRAEDVMARFGGDEFAVILQEIEGRGQVAAVARRILGSVNEPITLAGQSTRPTVSIGIAVYPDDGDTTEEIFRNADAAMHAVKRKEKNGFCFHHNSMNLDAQRRLAMKEQVSAALEGGEMRVMYQTIYSVDEKRIAGVEALARWRNGAIMVPPDNFLPYIENSEVITKLDLWVTETALREINGRLGLPDNLFININVAPIDLVSADFYRRFLDAVERGGGRPDQIHLEITESTTIRDFHRTAETLRELKAAGVQIYLDDFGEGYSSIRYLRELGVNAVKLDRAYISNVTHSPEARSLVSGFVQMAHGIDISAVVEGVETREQLDFLSRCGADYAQGYYFCKPVEIDGLCERTQLPVPDLPYDRRLED